MFEKRQKEKEEDDKTEELTQPLLEPEEPEPVTEAEPERNLSSSSINESRDLEENLPRLPQ
jgi:hypothetical protein